MKKVIIRIICAFIPIPSLRRKVRTYLLRKKPIPPTPEMVQLNQCLSRLKYLESLIKNIVRVDAVPPATGNLELIQKASASILAKFATVANRNHVNWWLDAGTLLGQMRHNGFVPWDDDVDIVVPRDDYEKLPSLLDREYATDGFFYTSAEHTRLYYKDLYVWVDVFPMDIGYSEEIPEGEEYEQFVATLNEIKSHIEYDQAKRKRREPPVPEECVAYCKEQRDLILVKKRDPKGFHFFGVETRVRNKRLYKYDWIYPLRPAKFLGIDVLIPNNADRYLRTTYGDWQAWPKNFRAVHDPYFTRDMMIPERVKECRELIDSYLPKSETV